MRGGGVGKRGLGGECRSGSGGGGVGGETHTLEGDQPSGCGVCVCGGGYVWLIHA